ncbi:hypothetical protein AVEN_220450-1 [Araneus ventricosus]|uniref:Uncharacterized protein n=1 Tax=Araneus ventricosus TaxID=182803 RepID=A0A4Y2MJU9_ARAVE|nr:hypothetical protein AVEN_220450-1 [Araneus ventricosus]
MVLGTQICRHRLGRVGPVVRSRLRSQRAPDPKPDSTEDPPYLRVWFTLSLTWVKRPPAGVVRKFGEGSFNSNVAPSSTRGSKVRSPSQNSPGVASKPIINATKL